MIDISVRIDIRSGDNPVKVFCKNANLPEAGIAVAILDSIKQDLLKTFLSNENIMIEKKGD